MTSMQEAICKRLLQRGIAAFGEGVSVMMYQKRPTLCYQNRHLQWERILNNTIHWWRDMDTNEIVSYHYKPSTKFRESHKQYEAMAVRPTDYSRHNMPKMLRETESYEEYCNMKMMLIAMVDMYISSYNCFERLAEELFKKEDDLREIPELRMQNLEVVQGLFQDIPESIEAGIGF